MGVPSGQAESLPIERADRARRTEEAEVPFYWTSFPRPLQIADAILPSPFMRCDHNLSLLSGFGDFLTGHI